jgi:hypothetical protein
MDKFNKDPYVTEENKNIINSGFREICFKDFAKSMQAMDIYFSGPKK